MELRICERRVNRCGRSVRSGASPCRGDDPGPGWAAADVEPDVKTNALTNVANPSRLSRRALLSAAAAACRGKSEKSAIWLNAAPNAVAFYKGIGFVPRASSKALPPGFEPMRWSL